MNKGYLLTFLGSACSLAYYIFAPISFGYFNYLTTLVLWFGFATIFSFFLIAATGKLEKVKAFKRYPKEIVLVGVLATGSVLLGWYGLSILGPGLTAFITRMKVIIIILLGIIFLKERFSMIEAVSAAGAILGVLLITHSNGDYVASGVFFVLAGSTSYSIARFIIKKELKEIDPLILTSFRALTITLIVFLITVSLGQFKPYWTIGLLYATIPSAFSAVLGHIFWFKAYHYADLSKTELITTVQPFLVVIASVLIFHEMMSLKEFIGGVIIVVSIASLSFSRKAKTA